MASQTNLKTKNANLIRLMDGPTETHVLATAFTGEITPLDCVEKEVDVPPLKQRLEI
jgi:hypothetical protein